MRQFDSGPRNHIAQQATAPDLAPARIIEHPIAGMTPRSRKVSMANTSFRVSPVTRYNLTSKTSDPNQAGVKCMGEFTSAAAANTVGRALLKSTPDSSLQPFEDDVEVNPVLHTQFVIVERSFDVDIKAFYADYKHQAEQFRDQLQRHFNREFMIFERELTDRVAIANREREVYTGEFMPLDLLAPAALRGVAGH